MNLLRRPSPQLAPFVDSLEYIAGGEAPHAWERLVPGVRASLIVTLEEDGFSYLDGGIRRASGACLTGLQRSSRVVSTAPQRHMVAVNFTVGGQAAFLDQPANALDAPFVALADLWGRDGATLGERLLEQPSPAATLAALDSLLARRLRNVSDDPAITRAAAALSTGAAVGSVVEAYGTTAKPFVRRFTARVGLTPKLFARLERIQRLLGHASLLPEADRDWTSLATAHGFYDQSHLIHDFTAITGVRPTQYRPRSATERNHLPLTAAADAPRLRGHSRSGR